MDAVTSVVSDAIDENKTLSVADVAEVNMGEFRPEDEPTVFTNAPTVQALERIAERLGRTNPHFHWFGSPDDQAAVVAIVSSRKPDEVADGIYRQLKRSADRQFSGSKPALLATNLLDISPDQLRDLASGPSALGAISDRLFASERRAHLFGVAFVSPADMPTRGIDADGAALSGRGMALLFRRDGHPLAHDPRLALFKPHVHPNGSAFLDHLPFWVARVGTERPN
jgi:hypothetical protein